MKNTNPRTNAGLMTAGQRLAAGITKFGVVIGLVHNTAEAMLALVAALFLAMKNYDAGKVELRTRRRTVLDVILECRGYLTMFRERLKLEFGNEYTEAWLGTGFRGSLRIWRKAADMAVAMEHAHSFLTANPQYELAALNLTAAEADVLKGKIADAITAVDEQSSLVTGLKNIRTAAAKQVGDKLRSTIDELKHRIAPLDERWKAFGLNLPGADETPDVPENVVAVLIGNTSVSLKWDAAPRAEYYRVWKRVVTVDAEFIAMGNPADRDFTLEGLPAGSQVEIAVSAVNNGGESQKSALAKVTTL